MIMDWFNQRQQRHCRSRSSKTLDCGPPKPDLSSKVQSIFFAPFIEDKDFPFCAKSLPGGELLFIHTEVVAKHHRKELALRLCV